MSWKLSCPVLRRVGGGNAPRLSDQGYRDPRFSERMFQYYYRVWDKFRMPVTALAILTDGNRRFHPKAFVQKKFDTCLSYSFPTYKLMEQDPAVLEQSDNPFAIVLLAARTALMRKKLGDEQLYKVKIHLLKRLLEQDIPKEKTESLLVFLEHTIRFRDEKRNEQFKQDRDQLIERRKTMGVIEELQERTRLEEKRRMIKNLILKLGLDDQQVASVAEVSVTFVRKIRAKLKLKPESVY